MHSTIRISEGNKAVLRGIQKEYELPILDNSVTFLTHLYSNCVKANILRVTGNMPEIILNSIDNIYIIRSPTNTIIEPGNRHD